MQLENLTIGNWYYSTVDKEYIQINVGDFILIDICIRTGSSIPYIPIELTEGILLYINIKKVFTDVGKSDNYYSIVDFDKKTMQSFVELKWKDNSLWFLRKKVLYLHDLQNLWQFLSDEKLIIKL